jgi:hypothetical protein
MNKQLAPEALCVDDKATRTIRSQPHDFANNPIACDFDCCKMALRVEGKCSARHHQRCTGGYRAV